MEHRDQTPVDWMIKQYNPSNVNAMEHVDGNVYRDTKENLDLKAFLDNENSCIRYYVSCLTHYSLYQGGSDIKNGNFTST